jgi:hypothetical protein
MKKSSLIFLLFVSFLFININSKKCKNKDIYLNKDNEKSLKSESNVNKQNKVQAATEYYQLNKKIEIIQDNKKLTMSFDGVVQDPKGIPNNDFKVIYIARFYDKQQLGIDTIQSFIENIDPLYTRYMIKIGNDTKEKMNWEIEIEENSNRTQIAILTAEAMLNSKIEKFNYNSFIFKYEKKKKDRTNEFWIIFGGMVGIVLITYCAITIFIIITKNKEKPTEKPEDLDAIQSPSQRETVTQDNSGTTS